jgi:hypothetical protein
MFTFVAQERPVLQFCGLEPIREATAIALRKLLAH